MRAIKYEAMSSKKTLMSCIASNTTLQFVFTSITGIANTTNYRQRISESKYSGNIRINFVSLYRKFISNREKKADENKCAPTSIMHKRRMRIFFIVVVRSVIQSIFSSASPIHATRIVTKKKKKNKKRRRADGNEHFDGTNSSGRPVANTFPFNWLNNDFCFPFLRSFVGSFVSAQIWLW